ncbi:MAG: choice-of-anchor U domain-containing protein [Thermodesulfobacteriota bacterium]|nr:choice-of-anchor U domain-containing protein [Thermodesulfobacteriota bacterium]
MRMVCLYFFMAFLILWASGAAAENLVTNPGFEAGIGSPWASNSQTYYSLDSGAFHAGAQSLKVTVSETAGNHIWMGQSLQVTPGESYDVGAWIKTESVSGAGAQVFVEWSSPSTWLGGEYGFKTVKGTQDWQYTGLSGLIMPENATTATVFVSMLQGSTGTAWFDDVMVERQAKSVLETVLLRPNYRDKLLPDARSPEIGVEVILTPEEEDLTLGELEITVALKNESGDIVLQDGPIVPSSKRFEVDLDIAADTPPGDYTLAIDLFTGKTLLKQDTYLIERLSQEAFDDLTSYIDSYGRFILNDEPFFPLGLYVVECTNGSYAAELDEIADSPFDTLMNYSVNRCGSDATDAQIWGYLDELALPSRDLKLIFSLSEYFDGAPAGWATWMFSMPTDGTFDLYGWWTGGSNRASDAPYMVSYGSFSQTINIDQRIQTGAWNYIGSFTFAGSTSGTVVLGNDANGYVIADAIGWDTDGDSNPDIIVDDVDAGFSTQGNGWLTSTSVNSYLNHEHYHARFSDDIATITHKVNTFKAHPAVISWYLNDERDPTNYLSQLEERYAAITQADGNHPVWSVHWNTDWLLQEGHTTDIVGMDSYPIENLPITVVGEVADTALQAGRPLWFVPQIFDWRDYPGDPAGRDLTGRPPTKEEMRAMTYLATNHGAKGLIYYSYFNIRDDADYGTRWPQIKEIAAEIRDLRDVILSIHQTNDNDIACDNSNIDFKLMREGNRYYLFAVNTKEQALADVSFAINMELESSTVDVRFEEDLDGDRQVSLINGTIIDSFSPYEVHVYSWQGAADKDGDGFDSLEEWGPNRDDPNYDGNGDGYADSEYANVASGHTFDKQHYVTLAVSEPGRLSHCAAIDNPDPANTPFRRGFPHGFFRFQVSEFDSQDGCKDVTLLLPRNTNIEAYYKYGRTPDSPDHDHWYEFMFDRETGAEIFHEETLTRIVLHLCDGKRGDDALSVVGTIVDTGGPAIITTAAPSVVTGTADSVTSSSAKLTGTVNPNGESTTSYFEYGTTESYELSTGGLNLNAGGTAEPVSEDISGLNKGTSYHFRLVATNTKGAVYGDDMTFTTKSGGGGGGGGCFVATAGLSLTLPLFHP